MIVAKGIDTKVKMETFREMNVNIQQGFYFQSPFKITWGATLSVNNEVAQNSFVQVHSFHTLQLKG